MSPRTELLLTQPNTYGAEFNLRTSRLELRCGPSTTPVTCGPSFPLDGEACGGEDLRANVWCNGSATSCQHTADGSRFCECTATGRWRCETSPSLPRGLRPIPRRTSVAGTACVRAGP
nr:hypothetical protein [Deltaproteobacteria bacterium]